MALESIKYSRGSLQILDQLQLPSKTIYIKINDVNDGWKAINSMQVRGAPAIAIVGCLSLAVELSGDDKNFLAKYDMKQFIVQKLAHLVSARPTAINMKNEAQRLEDLADRLFQDDSKDTNDMILAIIDAAENIFRYDVTTNKSLSEFGADEILKRNTNKEKVNVLTHCNTGALATAGYGTALGVIRSLAKRIRIGTVYCTETRPYNQGARLTAYELVYEKIPSVLICDNMAGWLMKSKVVDAVVTGADRVALNGDVANKIGTYSLAVLASYHQIPFYVASPISTFHAETKTGAEIVIEERPHAEMTHINGVRLAAKDVDCWNPAFDITPAELITGIITEKGVFAPMDMKKAHENGWKI